MNCTGGPSPIDPSRTSTWRFSDTQKRVHAPPFFYSKDGQDRASYDEDKANDLSLLFGYSLGQWDDELEEEARLAVKEEYS